MSTQPWPESLQRAREALEQALAASTNPEAAREAKIRFLQATAGQVYPDDVVPELLAFLQAHGFEVGQPHRRA